MNTPTQDDYLVREEPVRRLERVVFALSQAARRIEPQPDRIRNALRSALSARCARCGMRVTGEELLVLSQLPGDDETKRIQRLRSGCCAREGCQFESYELHFQNHPDLDWPKLLAAREPEALAASDAAEPAPEAEAAAAAVPDRTTRHRRMAIRVGALIGAVLLLFVFRQLYYGGRIPLLREPEKFRVTPAPEMDTNRPALRR